MAFPKHPGTGLPIIPPNTSLSFNLPSVLNLDPCERNYFDNLWANSRKPCLPALLTQFANYLHSKNLRVQLDDPNLRPRSLDAFLELKHTVEIMTGQIQELQKQLEEKKKQFQIKEEENILLKQQVEQEDREKCLTLEKFPPQIDQVKATIMRMVYSHKQTQLENHVEAIQELSLQNSLQYGGLSFCITRYQSLKHTAPNCACAEGFSITKATIDLSQWSGNLVAGNQEITVESLFENGLLGKLTVTHPRQLTSINLPWRLKGIVQDLLTTRPINIGFAVLEIYSVPPNYQSYPCEAQHYILIHLIRYGMPDFLVWNPDSYREHFIPMGLHERIKHWRAFSQAASGKLHRTSWLIAEEKNLKIFTTYELKHFQIPMKGILISNPSLVEHYKQIRAHWCGQDIGDNRIATQAPDGNNDDMIEALDDIGIMNLENAMEG